MSAASSSLNSMLVSHPCEFKLLVEATPGEGVVVPSSVLILVLDSVNVSWAAGPVCGHSVDL